MLCQGLLICIRDIVCVFFFKFRVDFSVYPYIILFTYVHKITFFLLISENYIGILCIVSYEYVESWSMWMSPLSIINWYKLDNHVWFFFILIINLNVNNAYANTFSVNWRKSVNWWCLSWTAVIFTKLPLWLLYQKIY